MLPERGPHKNTRIARGVKQVSAARVRSLLDYDPETGAFTWKHGARVPPRVRGKKAGSPSHTKGYVLIGVDGQIYLAHRLAWLHTYGRFPKADLDHRDRNPANNALSNLREASRSQNKVNVAKPASNTSGIKGVSKSATGRGWVAHIRHNYRKIHLGTFAKKRDAAAAYSAAAQRLFGEFAVREGALA